MPTRKLHVLRPAMLVSQRGDLSPDEIPLFHYQTTQISTFAPAFLARIQDKITFRPIFYALVIFDVPVWHKFLAAILPQVAPTFSNTTNKRKTTKTPRS